MKPRSYKPEPGSDYEQMYTDHDVIIEGVGTYLGCCHCGLVHLVEPVSGKDVALRWSLEPEMTEGRRRYMNRIGKLRDLMSALRRLI